MWFMMWSGVFDRFPDLKFSVTEAGCWWMPNLLWFWDRLYLGAKGAEKLSSFGIETMPSAIFDRNCFIGSSNTKRREIGMRYEIGIDNMPWGNDFPHPEGTWPHSREALAQTFHDVPIDETRRMIGEAAADYYGFDLTVLRPHAERINVTPASLGQTDDEANIRRWAGHREVGRHWLTGNDFPLARSFGEARAERSGSSQTRILPAQPQKNSCEPATSWNPASETRSLRGGSAGMRPCSIQHQLTRCGRCNPP